MSYNFRTDPENTDYVLEAGATRNFEALAKAEKLAEQEEKARKQELADNPMKLLEERTEASKNEMARMEALEELQELNKRTVKIDYDGMLSKYDRIRETEAQRQEREDEQFVRSIFGKDGTVIKRIIDEDGDSDDEKRPKKVQKVDKATDLLTGGNESNKKKESWEKSVGSLGSSGSLKKNSLGIVVKKKQETPSRTNTTTSGPSTSTASSATKTSSSLGLLGQYSDSDESD